jgi:hypothetical protein
MAPDPAGGDFTPDPSLIPLRTVRRSPVRRGETDPPLTERHAWGRIGYDAEPAIAKTHRWPGGSAHTRSGGERQ